MIRDDLLILVSHLLFVLVFPPEDQSRLLLKHCEYCFMLVIMEKVLLQISDVLHL